MKEIEYQCIDCGEYFEAAPGGADCPYCGSSETSATTEEPR